MKEEITLSELKQLVADAQQQTDRQIKQTDKQIKELGKQIGSIGEKFGSFTEGLAYPSMRKHLYQNIVLTTRLPITSSGCQMANSLSLMRLGLPMAVSIPP